MTRPLTLLCLAALALSAAPAHAQLGRLGDRVRGAAESALGRSGEAAARTADPERREAVALARQLMDLFHSLPDEPSVTYDGDFLRDGPDALAVIEESEAQVAQLDPILSRLYDRWGDGDRATPRENVAAAFLRMGIEDHEYSDQLGLAHAMHTIESVREGTAEARVNLAQAEFLTLRSIVEAIRDWSADDVLPDNIERAALYAARADLLRRIDPTNAEVEAFAEETATMAADLEAALREQIAAGRWPGHAAGAPSGLTPGIVSFLRSHPAWSSDGERVRAVAVRGGWTPHKHNLAGQVIQWKLPVVVASTKPSWDEWGGARMFEVSVLSQEGLPSAQGPPYGDMMVGLASGWIEPGRLPAQ